jgi:hypothetical protein
MFRRASFERKQGKIPMKFLHMLLSLTVLLHLSSGVQAQSLSHQFREFHSRNGSLNQTREMAQSLPEMFDLGLATRTIKAGCKAMNRDGRFDRALSEPTEYGSRSNDAWLSLQCCNKYAASALSRGLTWLAEKLNPYKGPKLPDNIAAPSVAGSLDMLAEDGIDQSSKKLRSDLMASGRDTWEKTLNICRVAIREGRAELQP